MNVYVVYKKSTGEIVGRYLGSEQTEKNIIDANGYDDSHDCSMCKLEGGYSIEEYAFNLTDGITKPIKTSAEKKLYRIQGRLAEHADELNIMVKFTLKLINKTRKELSLSPYTKQDVIDILKDII